MSINYLIFIKWWLLWLISILTIFWIILLFAIIIIIFQRFHKIWLYTLWFLFWGKYLHSRPDCMIIAIMMQYIGNIFVDFFILKCSIWRLITIEFLTFRIAIVVLFREIKLLFWTTILFYCYFFAFIQCLSHHNPLFLLFNIF